MCYVTDPSKIPLNHVLVLSDRSIQHASPVLCDTVCPIFLLNILLCHVRDSFKLTIKYSPMLCVRLTEYAC